MQTVLNRFQSLLGQKARYQFRVSSTMTWRENPEVTSINLLSTSALFESFHRAGQELLEKILDKGMTSAIVSSQIDHLAVTPAGMQVTLQVEVVGVENNHVYFVGEAYDETEKIAVAQFERVIVGLDFLKRKALEKARFIF